MVMFLESFQKAIAKHGGALDFKVHDGWQSGSVPDAAKVQYFKGLTCSFPGAVRSVTKALSPWNSWDASASPEAWTSSPMPTLCSTRATLSYTSSSSEVWTSSQMPTLCSTSAKLDERASWGTSQQNFFQVKPPPLLLSGRSTPTQTPLRG